MKSRKLLFIVCLIPLLVSHCEVKEPRLTDWEFNDLWYKDGWDILQKNGLQRYIIDSTCITGLVIVHRGNVVHTYGDIQDNSYIASCRKSVLAMI